MKVPCVMKQNVTVIFCLFLKKQEKKITEKVKKSTLFPENSYGKLYNVKCSIYHQNN